jgi:hypothetical protein
VNELGLSNLAFAVVDTIKKNGDFDILEVDSVFRFQSHVHDTRQ